MPGVLVLQHYWQTWSTTETHNASHWGQIGIFVSDGLLKCKGFVLTVGAATVG